MLAADGDENRRGIQAMETLATPSDFGLSVALLGRVVPRNWQDGCWQDGRFGEARPQ